MDEATVRSLLLKLRDAGVLEILFTGGGEPLLNAATPVGMQYTHDLGMKVGLYTNGALIDERTAKAIMEAQPAYVRLSLNAGQRRLYYQHHNPLSEPSGVDYFRNSYNALTLLAQEKARLRSKTVIAVSYLVDPETAMDVVNGARRVAETARVYPESIGYMRFTPSVNYFGHQQHPRDVFERALGLIENEVAPLLSELRIEPRVYFHRFNGLYESRPYSRCLAAGWYGGVGPGGILYWCCEKLFQRPFAFGSLLDSCFDELWAGEERRQVAQLVADAVKGKTASRCPVVCKPHEHNKVFAKIEKLREQGEIGVVRAWLGQIHRIVTAGQVDAKPRLDGFES
jgi:sulfatase maturation enzyme AslB (radical SAM superfamily)